MAGLLKQYLMKIQIKVQQYNQIKTKDHKFLGSISNVFNQLEDLEIKLKDHLNDIKTPVKNDLEKQYVNETETGCISLRDYILVESVTTEIFPVPVIFHTIHNPIH